MRIGNLPGIRRLPLYLTILHKMRDNGEETVSAPVLARESGFVPPVVRKDIEMTGAEGTTGRGFAVADLIRDIETFLGWDNPFEAFLVGAGHLGTAILGCHEFRRQGLNIIAAFDSDPAKIGQKIHGVDVMPADKLASLAARMRPGIAVLTVPSSMAQTSADILVRAGVKRIWSFAQEVLSVPDDVTVQREDLSAGLAELLVRSGRDDGAGG